MSITVSISEAKSALVTAMRANVVPMLHGSPAAGKSSIVREIAKEFNLELIDLRLSQCDPTDLLGFPQIDKEAGKAHYVPMATFPLQNDELPKDKNGWLLFLDECNSADRATQKAAYKLILDRMIGMEHLHERCAIMAAGNLATDNAIVEEMGTALQSRMVHLEVHVDFKEWIDWASSNGIDHRITSFINFKPALLYNFEPNHSDKTFASPRTWEFANNILNQIDVSEPLALPLLAGTLGAGAAREFIAFTKIYGRLPTIAQIVANPMNVDIPHDLGVQYAITGLVAHHINDDNASALLKFIGRMPTEFQVVTLKAAVRINRNIISNPAIMNWITENKMELA